MEDAIEGCVEKEAEDNGGRCKTKCKNECRDEVTPRDARVREVVEIGRRACLSDCGV